MMEDENMGAIFASLLQNLIKYVLFILIAWAGIVCGKKYRDHKDAKSGVQATKENTTK